MSSPTPRVHVHLKVRNLERSRAFYARFLGVEPVKVRPGYVKFLPSWGPLNLALSEGPPPGGPAGHLGIELGSRAEVLRELARVRAAGLPVREEMGVACCYAEQDKFWVVDPDGVEWEVYVLHADLDATPHAAAPSAARPQPAPAGGCCAP